MLRRPKLHDLTTTVAQARAALADDHVHALLLVDGDRLVTVVEREDLQAGPGREAPDDAAPAALVGTLVGRTVGPDRDPEELLAAMGASDRRRLAVVDAEGRLLGLWCRKRSGRGFCDDAGVAARAASRS